MGSSKFLNLSRNCGIGGHAMTYRRHPQHKGQVLVAAIKTERAIQSSKFFSAFAIGFWTGAAVVLWLLLW